MTFYNVNELFAMMDEKGSNWVEFTDPRGDHMEWVDGVPPGDVLGLAEGWPGRLHPN